MSINFKLKVLSATKSDHNRNMKIHYLIILFAIKIRIIFCLDCINNIRGIFSTNKNRDLHIVSDDSYFIIDKLSVARSSFYNLKYESIKFHKLGKNIKDQLKFIVDFDFYEESIYAIKKEPKRFKLLKLDIVNDKIRSESNLQDLNNLKSFAFVDEKVYAYFQDEKRIKFKSFKFYFEDDILHLDVINYQNETDNTFDKVGRIYVEHGHDRNESNLIFTKRLYIHFDHNPLANSPLFNYELNINRFTNCLRVLCDSEKINGIWFVEFNGTKNHAIIINNNYFLVNDLFNINGKQFLKVYLSTELIICCIMIS